ncbi:tetraacyldisaccharide 4'-kinase [Thalassotalea sediminis]|uniref:tetraacyldisaccharide 4'-kinase n=1 Tax=Thalassotalea sediminis TaxID=1759089 RepID=UPI0025729692|nr:tetraacyldisaccharide 4'-kinase [Thalassotalea sediminis]
MRLIEKVWFHQHPARYVLVPLLLPFSGLFWLITFVRRLCYRLGVLKQTHHDVPVVVVGNIGVGGNGKTPVVLWLIEQLKARNIKVGVISRGYGGKAPYYPFIVDDTCNASMVGDEPMMLFKRSQIPIVVGSDRNASIAKLKAMAVDIIISDDGLQHYKMARDFELIVVDGKRLFGNGLLLPAGPLREVSTRLANVDQVILNGDSRQLSSGATPQYTMQLVASKLVNLITGESLSIEKFRAKWPQVNVCAGIGSPERFFSTVSSLGFSITHQQAFVDHHDFQLADFRNFDNNIPLLMTEKDAVKCQAFSQAHWWYLPVDATFDESSTSSMINALLMRVNPSIKK